MNLIPTVEHYLDSKILCIGEFMEASLSAKDKLKRIIEREGDADGERTQPYYLAQLIAEAINQNRFSLLCQIDYEEKLTKGKECAAQANTPSNNNLILA